MIWRIRKLTEGSCPLYLTSVHILSNITHEMLSPAPNEALCPVWFVCLPPQKSIRSWEADSPASDERQVLSCPCRNSAIFHYQLVSRSRFSSISSISRVCGVGKHSSTPRMAEVRVPERAGANGWVDTGHICAISSTCPSCSTLSQQPEGDCCLPVHLLHLIISN